MNRAALFFALLLFGGAICSPSLAVGAIAPSSLVATPAELPGFATAKPKLRSATTASKYAKEVLEDSPAEALKEVASLEHKGFREGVQELLSGAHGEALSLAVVFASAGAARRELKSGLSADIKAQGKATIKRFTVAAVPGASGFGVSEAGMPGGAANVLFASGRCFLLVGNSLREGTAEQVDAAPIAGATALYQHVKGICK